VRRKDLPAGDEEVDVVERSFEIITDLAGNKLGDVKSNTGSSWSVELVHDVRLSDEALKWKCPTQALYKPNNKLGQNNLGLRIVDMQGVYLGTVVGQSKKLLSLKKTQLCRKDEENVTWKFAKTWQTSKKVQSHSCAEVDVYSMLLCRVCLGNPFLIDSNLMTPDAMHDFVWCQDPSDAIECLAEPWDLTRGHDSFFVKGQASHGAGLGVFNNEYIVFQPQQVLPLYKVDYILR
jgi:hypothetical protein